MESAWVDLSVFLALWRSGSATRAAERLDTSVSTVTRRLDRLEATLQTTLFVRTSDGVVPTAAGRALLAYAESAERAQSAARITLAGLREGPAGVVSVSLADDMVHLILLPVLPELSRAFPDLVVDLRHGPGLVDLMRLESDIAIRVVPPREGDELVARRLRDVGYAVFARPAYLAEVADPSDPAAHRWVSWTEEREHLAAARWLREAVPSPRYAMRSNALPTIRLAAAAGVGAAVLPLTFGRLTPHLAQVAVDGPPMPVESLWLVTHRALRSTPRVAPVWDWLVSHLQGPGDDAAPAVVRDRLQATYGVTFEPP